MKKLMLILLMGCFLINGCADQDEGPKYKFQSTYEFEEGDIIVHKITGIIGQVIRIHRNFSPPYKVRFFVGYNKEINFKKTKYFQEEWMEEFELELYEEK